MGQSKQKEMFIACGSSQSSSLPPSVVPSHIGSTATTSTKQSISQSSSAAYAIAAAAAEESDVPRATHLCADNKSAACAKPRLNHRPFRRQSYRPISALPPPPLPSKASLSRVQRYMPPKQQQLKALMFLAQYTLALTIRVLPVPSLCSIVPSAVRCTVTYGLYRQA